MGSLDLREVRTASFTDVGRVRSANQDACAEFLGAAGSRLLVVADGMGGHAGGEVASRTAVDAIGEWFENGGGGDGDMLREAFEAANERVFRMSAESPHLRGMGTTGVGLWVGADGRGFVVNVGDSRAYRLRNDVIEQITDNLGHLIGRSQAMKQDWFGDDVVHLHASVER